MREPAEERQEKCVHDGLGEHTTAGEPGVTVVKRSASRASTRLEYQNLVIMLKMTYINAMASSQPG